MRLPYRIRKIIGALCHLRAQWDMWELNQALVEAERILIDALRRAA